MRVKIEMLENGILFKGKEESYEPQTFLLVIENWKEHTSRAEETQLNIWRRF